MKTRVRPLSVLVCLGVAAATFCVRSASGNIVEQRIVTGFGFWNDDSYSIHASISLGSALPDGGYYIHFTEHTGASNFNAPF